MGQNEKVQLFVYNMHFNFLALTNEELDYKEQTTKELIDLNNALKLGESRMKGIWFHYVDDISDLILIYIYKNLEKNNCFGNNILCDKTITTFFINLN